MKKGLSRFRPSYIREMKQRVHTTQDAYLDQTEEFKKKYSKKLYMKVLSLFFSKLKKHLLDSGKFVHIKELGTLGITKSKSRPRDYSRPKGDDYRKFRNMHTDGYVGKLTYSIFHLHPSYKTNLFKWRCFPTSSFKKEMFQKFTKEGLDKYLNLILFK